MSDTQFNALVNNIIVMFIGLMVTMCLFFSISSNAADKRHKEVMTALEELRK